MALLTLGTLVGTLSIHLALLSFLTIVLMFSSYRFYTLFLVFILRYLIFFLVFFFVNGIFLPWYFLIGSYLRAFAPAVPAPWYCHPPGVSMACSITALRSLHCVIFSTGSSVATLYKITIPHIPYTLLPCFIFSLDTDHHLAYHTFYLFILDVVCLFSPQYKLCKDTDLCLVCLFLYPKCPEFCMANNGKC